MANLGTLWFGADIDLTALRNKIQSGNQSILNALKMDYDPASYQQMVSKLRSTLEKETFEIKLTANTKGLFGQGVTRNNNPFNFGNLAQQILDQQKLVNSLQSRVAQLRAEYKKLGNGFNDQLRANHIDKVLIPNLLSQIAQEKLTLNNLKATRTAYNQSIADTNKARKQASESAKQLDSDSMRLNATLLGGIHVSTQLGSALSSLFAIDAARQFLNNVVEIGGQLEKQRISMSAIIGDTARANELFEQIKSLAVKSPFGVVELDQYSKQLAAYGIEQSELFNMTKRLADISAGAGQDIGRLALALGHVKSATYLTGITLRQFSMNNIPMLKMLADYYSEVEKRAVSTAEVQKRISKRQVSYEDVLEQIKRMTDEGGMFYNMQEKISESVSAKWKNLKDSLDIMYGELAESKIGDALKYTAETLMGLTTKWKSLFVVLGAAATTFGLLRASTLAYNTGLAAMNAHAIKNTATTKELTVAQRWMRMEMYKGSLNFTLFGNKITALTKLSAILRISLLSIGNTIKALGASLVAALPQMALFAGVSALVGLWQRNNEEMEKAKELSSQLFERTQEGIKNVKQMMSDTGMIFKDQYENNSSLFGKVPGELIIPDVKSVGSDQMAKSILVWEDFIRKYSSTPNLMLQAAYATDENGKAVHSLAEQYQILGEQAKNVAESLPLVSKFGEYLSESIQESDGGWLDDNLLTDIKDYENSVKKYKRYAQDLYREHKKEAIAAVDAARANSEFSKALEESGIKSDDYASQLYKLSTESSKFKDAVKLAGDTWRELTGSSIFGESLFQIGAIAASEEEMEKEFDQVAERLRAKMESSGINPSQLSEPERLALTQAFADMATKAGLSVDEVTKKIWGLIQTKFPSIKLDIDEVKTIAQVSAIKEELNNLVNGKFLINIDAATNAFDVIQKIREGYKTAKDQIENAEPILIKLGLQGTDMSLMTDEAIEKYANGDEFVKQILLGVREAQQKANQAIKVSTEKGFSLTDPTKGGKVFKDKNGKDADQWLKDMKERLKELENFYKVYKRNAEYMSKDDAIQKALGSDVFKGKDLPKNIDDYLSILKDFRKKVESEIGAKPSTERKSFLTDLLTKIEEKEFEVKTKKIAERFINDLNEQISKESAKFDLYKSLLEKTGNRDYAKAAFEDGRIWNDLARGFEKQLQGLSGEINIDYTMTDSAAREHFEGIKGGYELWKKIVEITSGNYVDALNKGADAYQKTMTISQEIKKIEEEINALIEKRNNPSNTPSVNKAFDAQIKEAEKRLSKKKEQQQNESGEILQFYSAIFSMTADRAEQVGLAIKDNLVKKLQEGLITGEQYLKEIKRIDAQMDKMRKKKNVFDAFLSGGFQGVSELKLEIADDKLTDASNKLREANERLIDALAEQTKAEESGDELKIIGAKIEVAQAKQDVTDATLNHQTAVTNQKTATKNYNNTKAFSSTLALFAYVIQAWTQAYNDLKDVAAAYGENLDADLDTGGQYVMGIMQGVSTGISRLQSGDVVGAITGAIFGSIANIARMHDETLAEDQKESEIIVKRIDNMRDRLERALDRNLGGIYTTNADKDLIDYLSGSALVPSRYDSEKFALFKKKLKESGEYFIESDTEKAIIKAVKSETMYDAEIAQLYLQRDQIKRQLEDEKEKKNQDKSKIIDYESQIEELEEQIKYFAEDMAKSIYDIDVKSWAQELGDALFEAWQKGEDGAEAFKKKAREIITDVAKNIAATKLIETALAPVLKIITDEMEKKGGRLDEGSISAISQAMEVVGTTLPDSFNVLMEGLDEGLQNAGLGSMKDDADSSSSMSNTIKGITENTADLLASYINAMRADLSVMREGQNVHLPVISAAVQRTSVLAETQVTHLQQIAANTLRNADAADRIYDIMHKIDTGITSIKIA